MIEWLTVEVTFAAWFLIVSLLCTSGAAATGMYWQVRAMKAERELKTHIEGFEASLCEFRDGVKQEPGE